MGAVGGFVGPYMIGQIKERTGEFGPGLMFLGGCMAAAAVIVLGLRSASVPARREPTSPLSGSPGGN